LFEKFSVEVQPDPVGFLECVTGRGRPGRVYFIELFLDEPVEAAIARRFGLEEGLDRGGRWFELERRIRVMRFLGYDYVYEYHFPGFRFQRAEEHMAADTAPGEMTGGQRGWLDEHRGPVTTWEEFERHEWPEPGKFDYSALEWFQANLPDDMCMTSRAHSIFEELSWAFGLESLAYALYDDPDLVRAVADKVGEVHLAAVEVHCQFDKMRFLFGGDDMGHKTGTLVSPDALREFVLPWHRKIAAAAHAAGRPYLLHSCGNIEAVMPDLVEDVRIDGIHSFEDTIEPVEDFYRRWGDRVAVLGGVDMDFICRADEEALRTRVREILDVCQGGRYCLGTGNSVANYIPLDNYLAMLDEGRRYAG